MLSLELAGALVVKHHTLALSSERPSVADRWAELRGSALMLPSGRGSVRDPEARTATWRSLELSVTPSVGLLIPPSVDR